MVRKMWLLLVLMPLLADAARILGVVHMPAKSHFILGSTILKELAARGHQVTMVSAFGLPTKTANFTDIVLDGVGDFKEESMRNMFAVERAHPLIQMLAVNGMGTNITDQALGHPKFRQLVKSDETFDLVIMELFLNEAMIALAHRFNCPLILLSTIGANAWTNHLMGNPAPYSYVPDIFLSYTGQMSFLQRASNAFVNIFMGVTNSFMYFPKQNELVKKYFPDAPDLQELMYKRIDLMLVNSHVSITQAVPHTPNMIEIGGFHIKPPKKLDKDLQDYLDAAKDGVVYFSMGSNLKSASMPREKRDIFLHVFAQLELKVLWKWEDDVLPGKPDNVKVVKWAPQQEVLAHPNVRLFMTHGGLLSTTEAIYHGVPLLGIPIFGDQKMNMANAVSNGFAISVPFGEITSDKLYDSIQQLLNFPQYSESAKLRSKVMHDQPMKPLDVAMFWVDYVIRHNGAQHMRSSALDLKWYQYYMLDIAAAVLAILVAWGFFCIVCIAVLLAYLAKKKNDDFLAKKKKS